MRISLTHKNNLVLFCVGKSGTDIMIVRILLVGVWYEYTIRHNG